MSAQLFTPLKQWTVERYVSAAIRGAGQNVMRAPSANALVTGDGMTRAFKGVTVQAGKTGSKALFNVDQSYAGADSGSVFGVRQLLGAIGAGQVRFNGLNVTGFTASSVLSFIKKSGGSYAAGSLTGPFQAGHAQPSAPTAYAKSTPSIGQTLMSGTVSVVVWRVSSITGQVSLRSLPSNVVELSAQSLIVQVPLPDSNGQTHWGFGVPKLGFADLGVFYQLPTSLNGEVAETTLAYTRSVGSASIANTTNVVDAAGGAFTSADVGRRIAFGAFDSYITAINSTTQVQVFDTNNSGGTITATGTITHAVDGITRAVEISYQNGSLVGQEVAPDKAFPPPAGQFAGVINDVLWLESDGIIYVGEPNQIGSFPPSNSLFPNEPAVAYLRAADGYLRFGKHSAGVLTYVGGSPALEYMPFWEGQGIQYAPNVALGFGGRLMAWLGKPVVVTSGVDPDFDYSREVAPDFAGWEEQTVSEPVVAAYEPVGQYEVWCFQKKVMAKHAPSNAWCSPVDLTGKVNGSIVSAVTHGKMLLLSVLESGVEVLYQYDAGTGSVMVVQTDDVRTGGQDTISQVNLQVRADNNSNPVRVDIIPNYQDSSPQMVHNSVPGGTGTRNITPNGLNVIGAKAHAVRITMTSTGGDCGVDYVETAGATSMTQAA